MIKLLYKLGLALLPLTILTIILTGLAWHSGEALPVEQVVSIQQSQPTVIYGTNKLENIMPLKLVTYQVRQPEILILGSSRLLQFRDQFFTSQPAKVYNASGGGWQLGTMIQYYEQLPKDDLPKIIVLGIDQIWLNADSTSNLTISQVPETTYDFDTLRTASIATMETLLSGTLSITDIIEQRDKIYNQTALGLMAITNSFGYRADGSLQQGELIASSIMKNVNVERQITNFSTSQSYNYASGSTVRIESLDILRDFLSKLESDGVMVIGITVPYHYAIYDMMEASGDYTYMDKAYPMLVELFENYGFHYYYFDDLRSIGAQYNDWYDGWHVTESNSLRVLSVLVENHPDLFEEYTNIEDIEALLDTFTNPMDVLQELP